MASSPPDSWFTIQIPDIQDRPMRALVSFTLQRNLRANMRSMHRNQPVQVDRLVSYPLVFIHLRVNVVFQLLIKFLWICLSKEIKCGCWGPPLTILTLTSKHVRFFLIFMFHWYKWMIYKYQWSKESLKIWISRNAYTFIDIHIKMIVWISRIDVWISITHLQLLQNINCYW